MFGFAADVEGVHGLALHVERGLHGFDLAFEFGVAVALRKVEAVQFPEQVELLTLFGLGQGRVVDVGEKFVHPHVGGDDAGGLVFRGQEAVGPKGGPDNDFGRGPQNDVAGEVLVLGAEAVKEPRTQ